MDARPRALSMTPLLVVADLQRSLRFYRDVLGFGAPTLHGEPPCFAMLQRDGVELMLQAGDGHTLPRPNGPSGCWDVYLRVDDLDVERAALAAAGAALASEPCTRSYGMRELEVDDPDGHRWCLAQDVSAPPQTFAGALEIGGRRLRLLLHLRADGDGWSGWLDSPDQGSRGIPIATVARTAERLRLELPAIAATYDGAFDAAGDAVTGAWSQGGRSWPLVLARG